MPKKKKKSAFTFKELLFAYLAISKLMYWVNNISSIGNEGFPAIANMVINRLLGQDIMVIWILIAMFLLEHYIRTHPAVKGGILTTILVYGIGYLIYVTSIILYTLFMIFVTDTVINDWFMYIVNFSVFYIIACVFLHIKDRLKKKEAEMYIDSEKES